MLKMLRVSCTGMCLHPHHLLACPLTYAFIHTRNCLHFTVQFQVWDLGGQDSIRQVWQTYFVNTHAVILAVDSADIQRLPTVRLELSRLLRLDSLAQCPILCLANKQDAAGAASAAQVATALGLTDIKCVALLSLQYNASLLVCLPIRFITGVVHYCYDCWCQVFPFLYFCLWTRVHSPSLPPSFLLSLSLSSHLSSSSCRTHAWHIQACSALKGTGLDEGLSWLEKTLTK